MSSATQRFYAAPQAAAGAAPVTGASAWQWGSWVDLLPNGHPYPIAVTGVAFQVTNIPAADTTVEQLLELGTGVAGAEVAVAQVPHSFRQDTAVGYYEMPALAFLFPEPIRVRANVRVAVRATNSIAQAVTIAGVKLRFKEIGKEDTTLLNYLQVAAGDGMSVVERVR